MDTFVTVALVCLTFRTARAAFTLGLRRRGETLVMRIIRVIHTFVIFTYLGTAL